MLEFDFDDVYYLYIENREKSVVKLQRDYEWSIEHIDGVYFDLGTLFSNMEIDEVVDSLRENFDDVQLIDENEIEDYLD